MKQFLMDHFNINVSIKSIYNYNAALLRDDPLDKLVHSNSQLSVLLNCEKVWRKKKSKRTADKKKIHCFQMKIYRAKKKITLNV